MTIVEERVRFVDYDSRTRDAVILVALPVQQPGGDWGCMVSADPVVRETVITGKTSLQALVLALQFLAKPLHAWVDKGYMHVREQDSDEDVPLAAIFGPLWPT